MYFNVCVSGLGFATEEKMLEFFRQEEIRFTSVWGGIAFPDTYNDPLPKAVRYAIRPRSEQRIRFQEGGFSNFFVASDWMTGIMFPLFQLPGPRNARRAEGGEPCMFIFFPN